MFVTGPEAPRPRPELSGTREPCLTCLDCGGASC